VTQAFQGAWVVALALAKFNVKMQAVLSEKKMKQERLLWGSRKERDEGLRPRTGKESEGRGSEGEQRSMTPTTVGWGGNGRPATSVPVQESLSVQAMEKLSAFAVQQQLQRLEEEHNEIEQQVVFLDNNNKDNNDDGNNNININTIICRNESNHDATISQAHRLRTQSIALHRYFLNRKSNVHKGISLSEAIENSTANVCKMMFVLIALIIENV
jgi:hypothetical protein